ncbi:alpha/beta hydrolase [Actinokineospora enzanensis]|uniref:alpha/beta hydrolase n=1 Tax=Actinokineospora enzanensis TaxID=155975 RepID=UPI0003679F71|nr:alpha/beta hydrolase [Actinokineospora enzanensis]
MRVRHGAWLLPLALLAACTAGPSVRPGIVVNDGDTGGSAPTTTTGPAPLPPLTEPGASSIKWGPCGTSVLEGVAPPEGVEVSCGKVNGILDSPYNPGRGTVRMQVLRAGTGPIPLLVLDDIDGLPGTRYAARLAATLPKDLLARFSLIGLDRRGTGNSDPVRCIPDDVRTAIVTADPRDMDVEGLVDQARTAGQQCSITLQPRLPALDTWRTAGDVDSVRAALGVDKLNAVGHGEGSRVLAVFADRYPGHIGRLVLDGLPDPNEDAVVALTDVAESSDAAFAAFAGDCAKRSCELGVDARQALQEILDHAASTPLYSDELELTPGVILRAVRHGLSDRTAWPTLSAALAAARGGNAQPLVALISPTILEQDQIPATFDSTLVTRCNDTKSRLSTEAMVGAAKDWNNRFPLFGALTAEWLAVCSPWPVATKPVVQPTVPSAPPIVVLGTSVDPVTPLPGTTRAAQQLATASLVTWQGAGHGALGFSQCATDATMAYLLDGKVPRDGTVCPP